jgi:hypothetical protein
MHLHIAARALDTGATSDLARTAVPWCRVFRRVRLAMIAYVAALGWPCGVTAAGEEVTDLQQSDALVDAALRKLGGAKRLAAINTLVCQGKIEGVNGLPGTFEWLATRPDKRLLRWDLHYIKQETGYNGREGWERNASVRELVDDELVRARHASILFAFLQARRSGKVTSLSRGEFEGAAAIIIQFDSPDLGVRKFYIDPQNHSLLGESWIDPYEEGPTEVSLAYGDYRRVKGIVLPFSIVERRPGITTRMSMTRCNLNGQLEDRQFDNPMKAFFDEPYEATLETIPRHVYKESDDLWEHPWSRQWGIPFSDTESWTIDFVVNERYGRRLDPLEAQATLYRGERELSRNIWSGESVAKMLKFPISRFAPQPSIYGFRQNFSVPAPLAADRLTYTVKLRSRARYAQPVTASVEIPLRRYVPKTRLIFPIIGKFMVTTGHEFYEVHHKYEWSQQFSFDVVALGDAFEFAIDNGGKNENYVGFGRRHDRVGPQ